MYQSGALELIIHDTNTQFVMATIKFTRQSNQDNSSVTTEDNKTNLLCHLKRKETLSSIQEMDFFPCFLVLKCG